MNPLRRFSWNRFVFGETVRDFLLQSPEICECLSDDYFSEGTLAIDTLEPSVLMENYEETWVSHIGTRNGKIARSCNFCRMHHKVCSRTIPCIQCLQEEPFIPTRYSNRKTYTRTPKMGSIVNGQCMYHSPTGTIVQLSIAEVHHSLDSNPQTVILQKTAPLMLRKTKKRSRKSRPTPIIGIDILDTAASALRHRSDMVGFTKPVEYTMSSTNEGPPSFAEGESNGDVSMEMSALETPSLDDSPSQYSSWLDEYSWNSASTCLDEYSTQTDMLLHPQSANLVDTTSVDAFFSECPEDILHTPRICS
jgi:hypothetical protein